MKVITYRLVSVLLTAALSVPLCVGSVSAEEQSLPAAASVITDTAAYPNHEVLVMYTDHTTRLLTYSSDAALKQGLAALQKDSRVLVAQPNYLYTDTALSVNDELADKQWALYNDGSFAMQENTNDYPVYDNPFGDPSLPGHWRSPFNTFTAFATARTASTNMFDAVSGIDINVQKAWNVYNGGSRNTVVALIDTGVDYTSSDLNSSIWKNTDEISGNGKDDDGNGYIDDTRGWNFYNRSNRIYVGSEDDHGTHCAGSIIAASNTTGITGIVPGSKVKLMVLKALGGSDGSGTTAAIISAIKYAEANGASIVNLSLGTSENDQALYQTMAASKMLFVVAAGNGSDTVRTGINIDAAKIYPAAYALDNIISVANLNCDGTLHYSSNYGKTSVDLAAPGSFILSTTTSGTYSYMTGTSMAAPMVTAAAAMIYSYYKDITLPKTKALILKTTHSLSSLSGKVATGGMLDLGAAMTYPVASLPNTTWKQLAAAASTTATTSGAGSMPVISAQLVTQNGVPAVRISVSDPDGDLSRVAYASGIASTSSFAGGSGKTIKLSSKRSALFQISRRGVYTIYAVDAKKHAVVRTITFSYS